MARIWCEFHKNTVDGEINDPCTYPGCKRKMTKKPGKKDTGLLENYPVATAHIAVRSADPWSNRLAEMA